MYLKKSLGQHLLQDQNVARFMVEKADINSQDIILEIGPGTGIVTRELLKKARKVIAVELDDRMVQMLLDRFSVSIKEGKLQVIKMDILKLLTDKNVDSILNKIKYKVVASLPYNIGTVVIRYLLERLNQPQTAVVLVQKEVAERMASGKGKRSLLTNAVQYYANAQILQFVPPEKFIPPPKVMSAILKLDKITTRPVIESKKFFRLLRIAFSSPRKTLVNNLLTGYPQLSKEAITAILKSLSLNALVRAENLNLVEWKKMSDRFATDKSQPAKK
jgi:16S rRNA (adenine1518-N6/adenine1519-N6)-dimethyltransferase